MCQHKGKDEEDRLLKSWSIVKMGYDLGQGKEGQYKAKKKENLITMK